MEAEQEVRVKMENVAVVLIRPKFSGNVGSVARCAKNTGIGKLIVVGGEPLDREEVLQRSTHAAADLVDGMERHERLEEAVAGFTWLVGTTARRGSARGPGVTPRDMARQMTDLSRNNRIALLFGPEDKGLSNEELRLCQTIVNIPTSEDFRSLNLSHAVMILCYELFLASVPSPAVFRPRLASSAELEGMYGHLRDVLTRIGFINRQNPEYWMLHLRRLFSRVQLQAREVKIVRGICRQIDWAVGHPGPDPGRHAGEAARQPAAPEIAVAFSKKKK
jgi:tRNA/rRNA methyltransferase